MSVLRERRRRVAGVERRTVAIQTRCSRSYTPLRSARQCNAKSVGSVLIVTGVRIATFALQWIQVYRLAID